jgi:ferric-dicitrate binding protein FerR (iron transport regulator)
MRSISSLIVASFSMYGVGRGNVGLRLVVVVIADEVLDRVLREEALEFLVELRSQRLVVRHDQRRAIHLREHLRHREGLTRPGDAEQNLVGVAAIQAPRRARAPREPDRRAGRKSLTRVNRS